MADLTPEPYVPTHQPGKAGTLTGAVKDKCKCDECRNFWNAYQRWYKAYKQARLHMRCPTCTCPKPPHPKEGKAEPHP